MLNTIAPEVVKAMLDHALRIRHKACEEEGKKETIEMSDKWRDKLKSIPFKSKVSQMLV